MAARNALTIKSLAANSNIDASGDPDGTAIAGLIANGVKISGARFRKLFINVVSTVGSDKIVTIKAGASPPAESAGQGDLAVTVTALGRQLIGPFESARFMQANGDVNVDITSGMTGFITAYALPSL